MDYHDIEWFALETNRDGSIIFDIAPKDCISDSFVDFDPGREAAQSALGEGASPSRSRLLAFAPGKEGRKEQAGCGGVGVWET